MRPINIYVHLLSLLLALTYYGHAKFAMVVCAVGNAYYIYREFTGEPQ